MTTVQGWSEWHSEDFPIQLGISSCLLGEKVRYDGGHCKDRFVTEVLGQLVNWVSVCPEMGIGMPSPRPTIRLELGQDGDTSLRLIEPNSGVDHTDDMREFAHNRWGTHGTRELDGYILKKNSPSCGLERLSIYKNGSKASRAGMGIYSNELQSMAPDLPLEEEGRLNDPLLREGFITQVFARNRWRRQVALGLSRRALVVFHTAHKLLLRAHDETAYQTLGGIVGSAGTLPDKELSDAYGLEFLRCVSIRASVKRHCNVMQHVMGYFKNLISSEDKHRLLGCIEDYRNGLVPLVVPVSLLRYNAEQHRIAYLLGQLYFDPYPKEWMLRNHSQQP